MNATQGALLLDEILTDPTYHPLLNALHQAMPAHIRDQADAAHIHTTRGMNALIALLANPSHTDQAIGDTPDWLRLDAFSRLAGILTSTADTCRHNPGPHRPEPLFAAACKPNLVTCGNCLHLLSQPRGSAADSTCDSCGHICTGPRHGDGIFPGLLRVGLLVFMYGTCGNCHPHPEVPRRDPKHRLYQQPLP